MPLLARRTALAGLALGLFAACSRQPTPVRGQPVSPGATVLALGDSITHGTGAPAAAAYPAVLARLTGWDVVNAGVPGHTSAQALQRLPGVLADDRLKSDAIHGNAAGYEAFARSLFATLQTTGLLAP